MYKDAFRGLLIKEKKQADVILTGICYDEGCSCGKGAHLAPTVMRDLSTFLPPLTMDGNEITTMIYDNGDCNEFTKLEEMAQDVFKQNKFSLFLGGDHSVTIPLQKAFYDNYKEEKPAIIHIDAHPDICDFYDGSNYSHACTNRRALDHGFKDEDITMIGIRGYEKQEVEFFKEHPNVKVYQASYINECGIKEMVKEIISRNKNKTIYLSYDIDANDPSFAPGTGTPEAFGLNSNVLINVIKELFKSLNIQAMDIVEVSPPLDNNDITSWLALKSLYEILPLIKEKRKR